jgi:hypothetical protein
MLRELAREMTTTPADKAAKGRKASPPVPQAAQPAITAYFAEVEKEMAAFTAFLDAMLKSSKAKKAAQAEREAISKRTKEALSVARSRGTRLGNPNGAAALRRAGKGGAPLRAAIARNADRHARDLSPVVADIRDSGHSSLRAIAGELNARGMLTRRGGRWHVSTVMNLLDRLGLREERCARAG